MDNDFARRTPRPIGQPMRQAGQPHRPIQGNPMLRPMPPRPQPLQPIQHPKPTTQHSVPLKPITPHQPAPVKLTPAPAAVHTPQHHTTTHQPSTHQHPTTQHPQTLSFDPKPAAAPTAKHSFSPPHGKPKKKRKIVKLLSVASFIALIIVAIAGIANFISSQKTISSLEADVASLQQQVRSAQQTAQDLQREIENTPGIEIGLTDAEKNTITTAITSGNYEAIQPYLTENTLVIVAASDGIGRRTSEQVVKDLEYLNAAVQPWNFALSQETLDTYANGDYYQYFPESAIVGRSADNKVVSFHTTPAGKIPVVFMASDENLLK